MTEPRKRGRPRVRQPGEKRVQHALQISGTQAQVNQSRELLDLFAAELTAKWRRSVNRSQAMLAVLLALHEQDKIAWPMPGEVLI